MRRDEAIGREDRRRGDDAAVEGEVRCGAARVVLHGRALALILWLVARQARINDLAADHGQLWLTWKGEGAQAISGDIRTGL